MNSIVLITPRALASRPLPARLLSKEALRLITWEATVRLWLLRRLRMLLEMWEWVGAGAGRQAEYAPSHAAQVVVRSQVLRSLRDLHRVQPQLRRLNVKLLDLSVLPLM